MSINRFSRNVLSESEKKVLDDIQEFGWHIVVVQERDKSPGWAFSVGLYERFKHPEALIFGLPRDLTPRITNIVGEEVRAGKTYEAGKEYSGIVEGLLCTFQAVEKCWYEPFLGYARWFYQGDEFPVLQCIWPDKEQNYPWSPEFSRGLMWRQPLLFHTDIVKANAEELVRSLSEHDQHFYGDWLAESESSEVLERGRTPPASHHKFSPSEWPFGEPENTEAFTTARVIEENHPILLVAHDDDGDWQVLCGTTNAKEQARAVCLGCLYERDKTIGQVADLPRGWEASRRSPNDPWRRSRLTSEPD